MAALPRDATSAPSSGRRASAYAAPTPEPGPITQHWKSRLVDSRRKWEMSLAESQDELEVDLSRTLECAIMAIRVAELPFAVKLVPRAAGVQLESTEWLAVFLARAFAQLQHAIEVGIASATDCRRRRRCDDSSGMARAWHDVATTSECASLVTAFA